MNKILSRFAVLSSIVFGLSACQSNRSSGDAYGAPALGTNSYAPLEISSVSDTGTFVGRKAVNFRSDLSRLQDSIKKDNDELQKIRASVRDNAQAYHRAIAAIEAKLQIGTTPGNPNVLSTLQTAQENVRFMGSSSDALGQLSAKVGSDVTASADLLDSIRASYAISGAVDEDHSQLRVLENETNQTYVLLDSLLKEVSNDASLQQQYVDTANAAIRGLEQPIRQGNYGGVKPAPRASLTRPWPEPAIRPEPQYQRPRTLPAVAPSFDFPPARPQALSDAPSAAPAKPVMSAQLAKIPGLPDTVPSGKPFFTVRFAKADVDYKDGLGSAVRAALERKPDVRFVVVAVNPAKGSYTDAQKNAGKIFRGIVENGVSPDNVGLASRVGADIQNPEVQVFVK